MHYSFEDSLSCRLAKKGLMTAEDHIKRVKFAKYMKANYGQEIWKEGIAFYPDGTGFTYKRNPLDQARAPKACVWRNKQFFKQKTKAFHG